MVIKGGVHITSYNFFPRGGGGVTVGLNHKRINTLKKFYFLNVILPSASTYFVNAQTAKPT